MKFWVNSQLINTPAGLSTRILYLCHPKYNSPMVLHSSETALRNHLSGLLNHKLSLGFVPTMGALHEGHLALVKRAKKECDLVVVSIFVNPIQFNNPDDLKKYPRDLQNDMNLLNDVLGEDDTLFAPSVEEMYPEPDTRIFDLGSIAEVMEGAFRPGHFNGVAIVVDRLFRMVRPTRAYFGEKDYQQIAVIRRMVELEKHPVEIIPCPTVRESDGLAMSSRNVRLLPEIRESASTIFQCLTLAQELYGHHPAEEICQRITDILNQTPGYKTEYVSIADAKTLQAVTELNQNNARCFIAAWAGEVRLIDNLAMKQLDNVTIRQF